MIARISGTLIQKTAGAVVVDSHGIGYRVFIPLTTFYELPATGETVTLHTHTHVREDAMHLYGFLTEQEKEIFQVMLSATGIGPKLALNILSGASAREIAAGISEGNLGRLTVIPGVGKKTAERMVLELKDKVAKLVWKDDEPERVDGGTEKFLREDACSALVNLGYRVQTVHAALDRVEKESEGIPSIDVLLKRALKILAG